MLCCGYTLTDFPISIRLTSLALWQSNDCPSASKATLMNMDKHFMWIHYERLHNHSKAKHNKPCAYFVGYTVSLFYHQNRLWGTPGPQPTDNLPRKPGFHTRTQVPSRHCLPRQCGLWQSPRGSALWVWCPTRDRPCLWPQPDCRGGRGCWTWYQSSDEISWCVTWKGMCVCGIIDIITPCLHLQGVWVHNAYLQL